MTTTCQVTVWSTLARGNDFTRSLRPCGQPVVAGRLCAKHESDRVRLGGAA